MSDNASTDCAARGPPITLLEACSDVEWIPVPVPIGVEPDGVIGHVSAVWLGFTAGLSLGSH